MLIADQRGLTLIELVLTIILVGIIAGMASHRDEQGRLGKKEGGNTAESYMLSPIQMFENDGT